MCVRNELELEAMTCAGSERAQMVPFGPPCDVSIKGYDPGKFSGKDHRLKIVLTLLFPFCRMIMLNRE